MIVVSDATPLIGLAKIGQLVLLQGMFGEVLVPQAVYNEVVLSAPHKKDSPSRRRCLAPLSHLPPHLIQQRGHLVIRVEQ